MKGATLLGTHRHDGGRLRCTRKATADGQSFIEIELDVPGYAPPLTYRAWLPMSPKTRTDLVIMGVLVQTEMTEFLPFYDASSRRFDIDLIAVDCSDEETHGTNTRRIFVKNPRPLET